MPDSKNFLHPEAIKRIDRLELRAQHIVEGFMAGTHRSPYFGQSVEFLQHRQYVPGDDLRHVDWQVWARQDRLYVKQFEEETNMRVHLLVDVSKSMQYGSGPMNKSDYAATIAATLSYLVLKNQDSISCATFDEKIRQVVPSQTKRTQLNAVIAALENSRPADKTDLHKIFKRAAERFSRKGMIVVISDLFGDEETTLKGLRLLRQRGHEVILFHVLDDDELDFPFTSSTKFSDLESDVNLNCNPKALRDGYLEELHAFLEKIKIGCAKAAVDYALVRTSDSLGAVLAAFLSRRMARNRGS
jgi:uncharacterized protein (DUF58 family)